MIALASVTLALPLAAQQPARPRPPRPRPPAIPTPRSVLGFEPGDEGRLAEWPALLRYYQALARASDRVEIRELGRTTLGQPFVVLLISSPRNLARLDRLRAVNARLADPRTIRSAAESRSLLREGRTVVLITSSIHSTEVGGHLTPAILAHRLATDTGAATRAILDETLLLLVPSLNPDGINVVTRWYNRTRGTPAEGTDPPELYHPYVGHDNNRDWYAFTQVETRLTVDSLHNVWHPQIVHDIHQQGSNGSRIFLPPFLDPIEPNVDPLIVDGVNALGTAMAWELAGQGKTGIAINAIYDAWTPARAYQHYHAGVRILSETASADLASSVQVPFNQLVADRGFTPRERSWNFTQPWPGGRWTLRDIVTYQTDAAYALLSNAARYRDRWLANFLAIGQRAVRGWRGWPYAYVVPRAGQDTIALATLLGILERGGVQIRTATQAFTAAGQRVGAGSYVIVLRQPYAAFAKTLLETQRYPDRRLYPEGPPERPYDVTAHTLPLLMGVTAIEVRDSIRAPLSAPVRAPRYSITVPPLRIAERETGGEAAGGVDDVGRRVGPPRVGLYRSYVESMDEGWTRWIFENWRVPFTSLVDSVIRAGRLKDSFDVIVLPDQEPQQIENGLSSRYPEPFSGGLGPEGAEALREFVSGGGTLVALNQASRYAVQALLLPVRNVLEGASEDEFYAPGSIFRLQLDTGHPVARGMPAQSIAWFEHGPAFEVLDSTVARVIGRYPAEPGRVLLSGWVLEPERVAGRAALLDVTMGAGHVILFGFRPQYRAQSLATYPLLFNSLQLP